jgi:hypothetical protein
LIAGELPIFQPQWSPDGSLLSANEQLSLDGKFRSIVHRSGDPPAAYERLPALPDGNWLMFAIWTPSGDALLGENSGDGSLWRWSIREREFHAFPAAGNISHLGVFNVLSGERLLTQRFLSSSMRMSLLNPESGKENILIEVTDAYAGRLGRDQRSLWLFRTVDESDLWIARLGEPSR